MYLKTLIQSIFFFIFKFQPLHERLNAEKEEKKVDVNEEEEDEASRPELDPYFINEIELENEQANLSEQQKHNKLKESLDLKQSGNNLFKEENYLQALDIYTLALKCCPLDFKKDRSVFYSNRSVCYLKMVNKIRFLFLIRL